MPAGRDKFLSFSAIAIIRFFLPYFLKLEI